MHRCLAFTWEISGGIQFTIGALVEGPPATKHTFGGKHGAGRESSWEEHSCQNVFQMNYKSLGSGCQVIICSNK